MAWKPWQYPKDVQLKTEHQSIFAFDPARAPRMSVWHALFNGGYQGNRELFNKVANAAAAYRQKVKSDNFGFPGYTASEMEQKAKNTYVPVNIWAGENSFTSDDGTMSNADYQKLNEQASHGVISAMNDLKTMQSKSDNSFINLLSAPIRKARGDGSFESIPAKPEEYIPDDATRHEMNHAMYFKKIHRDDVPIYESPVTDAAYWAEMFKNGAEHPSYHSQYYGRESELMAIMGGLKIAMAKAGYIPKTPEEAKQMIEGAIYGTGNYADINKKINLDDYPGVQNFFMTNKSDRTDYRDLYKRVYRHDVDKFLPRSYPPITTDPMGYKGKILDEIIKKKILNSNGAKRIYEILPGLIGMNKNRQQNLYGSDNFWS